MSLTYEHHTINPQYCLQHEQIDKRIEAIKRTQINLIGYDCIYYNIGSDCPSNSNRTHSCWCCDEIHLYMIFRNEETQDLIYSTVRHAYSSSPGCFDFIQDEELEDNVNIKFNSVNEYPVELISTVHNSETQMILDMIKYYNETNKWAVEKEQN